MIGHFVKTWGVSASTEPLSFAVDADSFSEEQESSSSKSATSLAAASSSSFITLSNDDGSLVGDLSNAQTDTVIEEELIKQSSSVKRKSEENQVPRLIDNKRKHLEKNLVCCTKRSAAVATDVAKDDA